MSTSCAPKMRKSGGYWPPVTVMVGPPRGAHHHRPLWSEVTTILTQGDMEAVNYFYDRFSPKKWFGFTLLAIDGSTVKIPRTTEVEKHFGVWSVNSQNPCPLARISQMFDVLNKITVDAIISPKAIGERELCEGHFLKLMPNDLVLLDRGYPAYWLFNLILSWGGNFCARVQVGKWIPIKKFFRSGKLQKIIRLKLPASSIAKCRDLGLDTLDLKLRLIRIELENGETEILITSLVDTEEYPPEIFLDLYHHRWPVGVSRKGRITQSVKVRPRLTDSRPRSLEGAVARKQGGKALRQHSLKGGCATYQVVTHSERRCSLVTRIPVAETVYNARRQQETAVMGHVRCSSPAGYQRRHGTKDYVETGEALDARRRNLDEEFRPITLMGKWLEWRQGGGLGCTTVDLRAAKHAGGKDPDR